MRNQIIFLVLIFSFLQFHCKRQKQPEDSLDFMPPKIVEAKSYKVSIEKMTPPEIVPVSGLKPIIAGKSEIVKLKSNVFPAKAESKIHVGVPKIVIPGEDTFKLPVKVPAIDSPFIAGIPEVFLLKDPYIKDNNPESFSAINVSQGLKSSGISCLCRDRTGNLWIGTWDGGVGKYDGRSLSNYTTEQGLSSNNVVSIFEDKDGSIWIGTFIGVNKFDGRSITHYSMAQGLSNNIVNSITQDKNGDMWFGTQNGLIKYDGHSFTHYTTAQGLPTNIVSGLLEDSKGNLWIGTAGGPGCGVGRFNGRSFENLTKAFGFPENPKEIKSILEDKKGNLWFCTKAGLYKFDGDSVSHFTSEGGLSSNAISKIIEDESGNFWIGTWDSGMNKYDGKSFTHFGVEQGISNNGVSSILEDKSGNIWMGTGSGICKYDGKLFNHIQPAQGLSEENISCTYADKSGNIWIGTDGAGANKFDGKSIVRFTAAQGLINNQIFDIMQDRSGNTWFGTLTGADKYDGRSFTHYTTANGLINNYVYCIKEDRKGNIWFGTETGLSKFDGNYFTNYATLQGLNVEGISSILEDHNGILWFGTGDKGVCSYDGNFFTHYNLAHGLSNPAVSGMIEDKNRNLWFCTTDGVNKFDGKYFTHYTTEQGLSNNIVKSILEDKNGNIWVGTINGLNRFRPLPAGSQTLQNESISWFKKYTRYEGFSGIGTHGNSITQDENGNIWIGAMDRLTNYHPEGEIPDTIPPIIQLSGIALFYENINWFDLEKKKDTTLILSNGTRLSNFNFSGLTKWYNQPENLRLTYNNNYLSFQFIGITTNQPKEVRYKYFLEGLDENWSTITNQPEAVYNNLPSGEFIFRAKAVNSEGYWSKELSYSFSIAPPWWKTWWMFIVYGAVVLGTIVFIIWWNSRRLISQKKVLEQEVTLATKQIREEKEKVEDQKTKIEETLIELKSTQAQLIQSEKMASLGELTSGIAHEIQNPLNFVNNFSEVNKELLVEMKDEMKKGNLDDANEIANDVIANEEKINHHGKRAGDIVKVMLQHSRTSTGKKEPTDINALCDEYLRLAYHGLKPKDKDFNATMQTDFDESIGTVNIISQDIGRVLLNLYNNAFYSTAEKKKKQPENYEPTVSVSTKKIGDKISINVKDNGNGIPQKIVDKIFQPFFTTKPAGQGTGLGLSLSYDIIKAYGGEIKVETRDGERTEFIIQLPVS